MNAIGALDRLEQILYGEMGPSVLRTLARFGRGDVPNEEESANLPLIEELGLGRQTESEFELTSLGYKCADAAREYLFWLERDRQVHGEDTIPLLALSNFRDTDVLELGAGWGCNVFRLHQAGARARGREIEEVYVRFTRIIAKIEGITPPPIDLGSAEQLPYSDESFDWVLMFSALQFMDIPVAMREIVRVLRPGGTLITTQPLLGVLLADLWAKGRRGLAHRLVALGNSISYGLMAKRVIGNVRGRSTARPVYLTSRRLVRMTENAGLQFQRELSGSKQLAPGRDYLLVAKKVIT